MELRDLLTREQQNTTAILAVAIDSREDLQKMVNRITRTDGRRPDFPFLSDPGHRVIDRQGVIRWKFTEVNYKIRPTNDMILRALAKVP